MKDESDNDERSKKSGTPHPKGNNPPKNNKRRSDEGGSELVINPSKGEGKNQRRKGGKSDYTIEVAENQSCKLHSMSTKKLTHLLKNCFMWKCHSDAKAQQKVDYDKSFGDEKEVLNIFTTTEKSEEKCILHAVNTAVPPIP
jgi:hypothetical protein